MRKLQVLGLLGLFMVGIISCNIDPNLLYDNSGEIIVIPNGFPEIEFPEDNKFTEARWLLGKRLFYDKSLSIDSSTSCASCHQLAFAFADNSPTTKGAFNREGTRNVPSLANIAYHPYFTREGGVPTLEMQVLVPIQEHNELGFNIVDIENRLKLDSSYINQSILAYNRSIDAFTITRALATFERSLISGNSLYDLYIYGLNSSVYDEDEVRGLELFQSERLGCNKCHSGFDFTNYTFENNGLYTDYKDIGRKRLTGMEKDLAKFKVPSLRNVMLTAPYMHDGSISTISMVIEHYNSGGNSHPNKSELIKPLNLTENEKYQLEAFLQTLSDTKFINNPLFKN